MTKTEYVTKAQEWLARAEQHVPEKITMAQAANWYAPAAAAAAIANVYATLAVTADD